MAVVAGSEELQLMMINIGRTVRPRESRLEMMSYPAPQFPCKIGFPLCGARSQAPLQKQGARRQKAEPNLFHVGASMPPS